MKRINGLSAAVVAVVMVAGTSAFADSRPQNETWRGSQDRGGYSNRDNRDNRDNNRSYRDNDRVTLEGKVRSFTRERDGYRVQLDNGGYPFFVPEKHIRNRNEFRVGVSIRLGGVFRGGSIFVDAVDYPGAGGGYDPYYGGRSAGRYDSFVRGTVERIDFRNDTLVLRDNATGRFVTVDMRSADRRSRSIDVDDLRRGDYLSLSGEWVRGGVFSAYRIDSVDTNRGRGRY